MNNSLAKARHDEHETRALILSEAVRLFAENGYNGTSMRKLAEATKITPAALYYHFPNKKNLYASAVVFAYSERSTPAADFLKDIGNDPWKGLEAFILRLCDRFYHDVEFRRLLQWSTLDAATDETLRSVFTTGIYEINFARLVDFIKKISPDISPHRIAMFIYSLVIHNYNTYAMRRKSQNFNEDLDAPEALTRDIMTLLRHGILGPKK